MQVMFDSKTRKVVRKGDHNGTPRLWTVTVWTYFADGRQEKQTFKVAKKTYVSSLATVIDELTKANIVVNDCQVTRQRWHAIAR